MNVRREFIKRLFLLSVSLMFVSCKRGTKERGPVFKSSIHDIHPKLDLMIEILKQKGFDIKSQFKPGLSRDEVLNKTSKLSFPVPEEIISLYTWRNGPVNNWMNSPDHLFIFRDHCFLDIDQAIEEAANVNKFYKLKKVFPFASFEGSTLALPVEPYAFYDRLERPVINIFEGVSVHFFSLAIMLDTVNEWFEMGVHNPQGGQVKEDLELEIWQRHNPGFQEMYDI